MGQILTTLYLYEAQLPVHGEILQVHGTGRSDSEPANRDGWGVSGLRGERDSAIGRTFD